MSSHLPRRPLVVVVGATGTGKSQLAVSLAERFNGEIINGDALQMYEGLTITTNKTPLEERRGIPHHLLGCVKLEESPWTVRRFHDEASKIIQAIRSRGKIPILVGGTHYYLQSLLFPKSLVEDIPRADELNDEEEEPKWPILAADSEVMYDELTRVDPEMARKWHPGDRRKIRRSLQIWLQTGRRASCVYREQKESLSAKDPEHRQDLGNAENFLEFEKSQSPQDLGCSENAWGNDPLIFWTYSSPEVLNQRLEKRVDYMISNGLLGEVQSMHDFLQTETRQGNVIDKSRGPWIAIGCKEMLPYISNFFAFEDEKKDGIERTKIATRQYAKRQTRWIRLKLLHAMKDSGLEKNVFMLDATDISQFSSHVEMIAGNIVSTFLAGDPLPEPITISRVAKEMLFSGVKEVRESRYCEACDKTMMSGSEWLNHLKSKGHKNVLKPKVDWKALYPRNHNT